MEFIAVMLVNIIKILKYALLVRILMSWLQPQARGGRFYALLHQVTEPILRPVRNLLPRTGMIDFSPIIAFFLLDFVQIGVYSLFASF